ncbi:MAG: valine--tRNA ligase [Terriglobales bacterium]
MFKELPKTYDPQEIEPRWARAWVDSDWFRASAAPQDARPTWSLVIPPPNVTGSLHMGHMLEHTEIDAIVRWQRMRGANVLWLPGTDHAGIATQMVVERDLAAPGQSPSAARRALGREAFVAKVWEWKARSGGAITQQMMRLGASCDWSRERFTLDEGLSRAVREVFVKLYEEGLIYRGRYIVNWCPRCQTAVSDLEVSHVESQGKLYHVRYAVVDDPTLSITVATTRPETILGDVAVAVNPGDARYQHLVGRRLRVPLLGREIPVIADELAQPEFGTGAVKVTPAHDPNDYLAGERHKLPQIEVINDRGEMTEAAGPYAGLDRFVARERVLLDLDAAGQLAKTAEHPMAVGHCQRCRTVIEPRLSTQWFVRTQTLAADAIRVVEEGHLTFVPPGATRAYLDWMRDIHDWCISRQLWWGHRIPAWHCACGEIVVARSTPGNCPQCGSATLTQDPDVLDTWFSSGLWPFSTLGWPDRTPDLAKFYPTSLLITGVDILFFWVARMVMLGVHCMRQDGRSLAEAVPFRQVYVHALVRDADRQKMSKTKGNVIDPLEVTAKYGTDAVRFTLVAMAAPGTDIALSEARMDGYRAFANKIWNAARFLFMTLSRLEEEGKWTRAGFMERALADRPMAAGTAAEIPLRPKSELLEHRWIFSRLHRTAVRVGESFEGFRFHDAADALYHFYWDEFCDWYIELVKLRLADPALSRQDASDSADNALAIFDAALRLLHPLMPFLTEELWQAVWAGAPPVPTIALADYPQPHARAFHPNAEKEMNLVQEVITQVRSLRGEWKVVPKTRLKLEIAARGEKTRPWLEANLNFLQPLAGLESVTFVDAIAAEGVGRVSTPDYDLRLDLRGAINLDGEKQRLVKERDNVAKALANTERQLASETFLARAPEKIVADLRGKQAEYRGQIKQLEANLAALGGS